MRAERQPSPSGSRAVSWDDAGPVPAEDGSGEGVLAAVVAVERAFGHARRVGDLLDAHRVEPLGMEKGQSRAEEILADQAVGGSGHGHSPQNARARQAWRVRGEHNRRRASPDVRARYGTYADQVSCTYRLRCIEGEAGWCAVRRQAGPCSRKGRAAAT